MTGNSSKELIHQGKLLPPTDNQQLQLRIQREGENLKRHVNTNICEHKKQTKEDIQQVSMTSLHKTEELEQLLKKLNIQIDSQKSEIKKLKQEQHRQQKEQHRQQKEQYRQQTMIAELKSLVLKSKLDSLPPLINTKPNPILKTSETTPTMTTPISLTTLDKLPPITTIRSETGFTIKSDDSENPTQLQRIRNRQSNGSTPELNVKRRSGSFSPVTTPNKFQSNLVRSQQRLPPISNNKPTQKDVKRHSSLPTSSTVWLELATSSPKNSRKQLVAKRKTKTTTYKHTQ